MKLKFKIYIILVSKEDEYCFYQAGFIHKLIINLDLDKKHELAFLHQTTSFLEIEDVFV